MEMVLIFTFCLILAGTDAVTTVTGYRGRSVQIKCPYTSGYENYNKYLCRARVFTVTITDLRPEDEGTYWCAIEKTWHDKYTEILLLVEKNAPAISTVSDTTHTTHSTSTESMSTSLHAESTHLTTANLLNDVTHPTPVPTSHEIPTVITAVSVVLVLLLLALLLAVVLQRKKKIQGSSPIQPAQSSLKRQVVPCPDFGEIKSSRSLSNTLYSTAPPPSNPSEIYCNTGLPGVPSDYSQAVYTTVDHPSDPPDQDFYSTAQLPTIPSNSSVSAAPSSGVKSPESLMYAAVSFDTRNDGAAPAVIYKPKNNSCEYATVNKNKHS
ncbi:CMRF35-like molecule 1 [Clarias gariepinus]|uniref:CMRF35-like molecule 1 n=1 Tax=Clarias gariepinus TaxID=13013 RepID=UPI00234CFDC8|nr:CMRF35-like molecule 1 [Clarias gariepinus]